MMAILLSPLARYAALFVAVLGFVGWVYHTGYRNGAAGVLAKIAAENSRRLNDAARADTDAMRCATDPECLWRSDGFKREK